MKNTLKLDFYASEVHYFDHIIPIWVNLPVNYRGKFYVTREIVEKRSFDGVIGEPSDDLTLVASWKDYLCAKGDVIFMEHGIGHTYSNDHPSYAGGKGKDRVVLFLCQHEFTYQRNKSAYPLIECEIIGTPKLDNVKKREISDKKIVCVAFHWDCYVCPETRSSFNYYKRILPILAQSTNYKLVMHTHPRSSEQRIEGIEYIENYEDILEQVDVYVNDNSSTMYEFLTTGRPIVVLNDPGYRKNIHHGIRFWDYIGGIQVERYSELDKAILRTLENPNEYKEVRESIVETIYPYLGRASERVIRVLTDFLERRTK